MSSVTRPVLSYAQYRALQAPVIPLPTPKELFEFQVGILQDKGLDLRKADVDRLARVVPNMPQLFIVVPRRPEVLDLNGLMALVEVNGIKGRNHLDPECLIDLELAPAGAHLLLGVEDGHWRRNIAPNVSMGNIQAEGRISYLVWYGLVHAIIFPEVLEEHHDLNLTGSRYYDSGGVPYLYRGDHGVSRLDSRRSIVDSKWGVPSAESVVA